MTDRNFQIEEGLNRADDAASSSSLGPLSPDLVRRPSLTLPMSAGNKITADRNLKIILELALKPGNGKQDSVILNLHV
jgi:hypothetical protein